MTMKRWVVLAGLLGSTVAWAAEPVSATGSWKIDGEVQGMPVKMTCVLTEADKQLTGKCTGTGSPSRDLIGEVTEKGVAWSFDSDYQGTPISIFFTGTLSAGGAKMAGTMSVAPMNVSGTFTATKGEAATPTATAAGAAASVPPAVAPTPVPAAAVATAPATATSPVAGAALTMAGVWKIEGEVMGQPVLMMCRLTQTAKNGIGGNCSGAMDGFREHTVDGKVKAKAVEWHFQSAFQGNAITVSVAGTVAEDNLKIGGTLDVEPMQAGGTFVGTRQAGD